MVERDPFLSSRRLTLGQMLDLIPTLYDKLQMQWTKPTATRIPYGSLFALDQLYAALHIVAERHAGVSVEGFPAFPPTGLPLGRTTTVSLVHVLGLVKAIGHHVPETNTEAADILWAAVRYCHEVSPQCKSMVRDLWGELHSAGDMSGGDDADFADAGISR